MPDQSYREIIKDLPPAGTRDLGGEIRSMLEKQRTKIVVLDDDPTGIQTVQDCLLLTQWTPEDLQKAFEHEAPMFYILTNSRSLEEADAIRLNREVMESVLQANRRLNHKLIFISRSDSTLRGHFPAEPETMRTVLESHKIPVEFPVFFIPSFFEAGRCTVNNMHFLKSGDVMTPVSETEFAGDSIFGYSRSDLPGYMMEKSGGRIPEEKIGNLPLAVLRQLDPEALQKRISSSGSFSYVSIDALEYSDLQKFSLALLGSVTGLESWAVLRTSSSLPKALGGIPDRELLTRDQLVKGPGQGMFIVGSHVRKSTRQLEELLKLEGVRGIEADVQKILNDPTDYLGRILAELEACMRSGFSPAIYTTRHEMFTEDKTIRLHAGRKISAFLTDIVKNLPAPPGYLVAKGGITSHDVLVKGIKVRSARVAGQILPGVPVIVTGKDHIYPNLPYIIFPGNVGDDHSLAEIHKKLT